VSGPQRRWPRRPLTRLSSAALAGHVAFELAAGVGMPFASLVGPVPAAAGWTAATAAVQLAAGRPGSDRALAAAAAVLTENRGASRWAGLLPLFLVPALVRVQHAEHARLRRVAVRCPAWWNRRLGS
jgi:hypothetical protein